MSKKIKCYMTATVTYGGETHQQGTVAELSERDADNAERAGTALKNPSAAQLKKLTGEAGAGSAGASTKKSAASSDEE